MSQCCKDGGACTNCGQCKGHVNLNEQPTRKKLSQFKQQWDKSVREGESLKKSKSAVVVAQHDPEDFDPDQLFLGVVHELAETDSPAAAQAAAMAKLAEDKDHYKKLVEVEKSDHPYPTWKVKKNRKLARRTTFQGLDISIETDKGQKRHWYDPHNKEEGTTLMKYPYGYIRRTDGADGEHIDVYVGPNKDSTQVFIVHQMKAPNFKEYDEDKVMLGFETPREAKAAYLEHYNNPKFFESMTQTNIDAFKRTFVNKSMGNDLEELESLMRSLSVGNTDVLEKGGFDKIRSLWGRITRRWKGKKAKPKKRWVRVGGTAHPCKTGVCVLLDGMEIDIDAEFPYARELTGMGMHGPPAHGHCRCRLQFSEPEEVTLKPPAKPPMVKPEGEPLRPPRPDEQEWTWAGGHKFKLNSPELRAYIEARTAGKKVSEALAAAGVKKALDPMTADEQDMTPMAPQQIPVNPAIPPIIIDPHDVETYEGVEVLLGRIGTVPDQELMEIASKIWGDGYDFAGQAPEQARAEIIGFLLDQRDLLGVMIDAGLAPSPSLLNMTQAGQSSQNYSGASGTSPNPSGAPQPGGSLSAGGSPGSYLPT